MISFLVFLIVAVVPFAIYAVNALFTMKEQRGIAAGIPKPKQAKAPKAAKSPRRPQREARVAQRRTVYCGKDFTHLSLAILGSQDSCKRCSYLQEVPEAAPASFDAGPTDPPPAAQKAESSDESDAAIRAAEEIIDRARH